MKFSELITKLHSASQPHMLMYIDIRSDCELADVNILASGQSDVQAGTLYFADAGQLTPDTVLPTNLLYYGTLPPELADRLTNSAMIDRGEFAVLFQTVKELLSYQQSDQQLYTQVLYMLKHLNLDFPITVVGYTLNTMVACQNRSNISLICGGGFYHRNTELFDSPEGVALISRLNINKCFMAAAGVTSKGNLSCIEPYEFMYKKAAINSSSTRILLVDSSKFGKMRPCMFSNLSDFDIVITDGDIGGNWIRLFEQSNLKYIIV